MKKVMIMSVRAAVDKKTNDNVVYVTVYDLGNRNDKGVIYSAKTGEAVRVAFANQTRNPEKYEKYKSFAFGDLCNMELGFNDFDNRVYVDDLNLVLASSYSLDDIYGPIKK